MERGMERRRERRYDAGAHATLSTAAGITHEGTLVNISGSGVLLRIDEPADIVVGDHVTCEIGPVHIDEEAFPDWGAGRVAWLKGDFVGVELTLATFQLDPQGLAHSMES
jgi:hypothetical protein